MSDNSACGLSGILSGDRPVYASFSDLLDEIPFYRLAEYVTDGTESFAEGELPEGALKLIENALRSASDLILGYIQGRYPVMQQPSDMLKKICASLALSSLVERKHTGEPEICGWARASRADQIKLLEAIRDGMLSIGVEPDNQAGCKIRVAERPRRLSALLSEW